MQHKNIEAGASNCPRHKANLIYHHILSYLSIFYHSLLQTLPSERSHHLSFYLTHTYMASISVPNHSLPTLLHTHIPTHTSSQSLPCLPRSSDSQFCGLKLSHSSSLSLPPPLTYSSKTCSVSAKVLHFFTLTSFFLPSSFNALFVLID